jgi:hypothetical protein
MGLQLGIEQQGKANQYLFCNAAVYFARFDAETLIN